MTNYKEHLEVYQEQIRTRITDIQARMSKLNDDILKLSTQIQCGTFYNCIEQLEQKEATND